MFSEERKMVKLGQRIPYQKDFFKQFCQKLLAKNVWYKKNFCTKKIQYKKSVKKNVGPKKLLAPQKISIKILVKKFGSK